MAVNFQQASNELDLYLVRTENKDRVPYQLRKPTSLWTGPGLAVEWGYDICYEPTGELIPSPRPMSFYNGTVYADWTQVVNANNYAMAIRNGQLWGWGVNGSYNIGNGSTSFYNSATLVDVAADWKFAIRSHAIKTDGTLWAWGQDSYILGANGLSVFSVPTLISSNSWKTVSGTSNHRLAIRSDGTLWAWGYGTNGALGTGNTSAYNSPVQIGTQTNWASVCAAPSVSYAIKTDGTLWAWGNNADGQLGLGDITQRSSPVQVGALTDWAFVAANDYTTMAIKTNGTLWSWGRNNSGLLGLGDTASRSSPTQVGTLTNWKTVGVGYQHAIALKTDGTRWAWGNNTYGVFGNSTTFGTTSSPAQVGSETTWYDISVNSIYNVGILLI